MRVAGTGSLSTPLAQACGKVLRRFVFGERPSKQSFKVVNWGDALPSGQFLEGRRSGALRSGRSNWLRNPIHESRIAGQRPFAVLARAVWCRVRRVTGSVPGWTARKVKLPGWGLERSGLRPRLSRACYPLVEWKPSAVRNSARGESSDLLQVPHCKGNR